MPFAFSGGVTNILPFPKLIDMTFERSTLRFFPLPADIAKLQAYCDGHLNFLGESPLPPVHFKAAMPYVVLILSDYPRMTQVAFQQWLQTREVLLGVPVEWYSRDADGKLHFKDWGMTIPYIYLDSPIAVSIGREIYGLPKGLMEVVEDPSQPANPNKPHPYLTPDEPRRLLAYNLPKFDKKKPGNPQEFSQSFLEAFQDYQGYPWSVTRPADLLSAWPRTAATYLSALSTIVQTTASMPRIWEAPKAVADLLAEATERLRKLAGQPIGQAARDFKYIPMPESQGLETFAKMMQKGLGSAGGWFPQMLFPLNEPRKLNGEGTPVSPFMSNHISLKQFPDAADPSKACYQAIVRSSAKFLKVNGAGLLFDPISGDPSGGLSIRIHDVEPIVDTLGIQATEDPDQHFATVKPLFPFWWNLDVGYGSAENLCWRNKNSSSWSTSDQVPSLGTVDHAYLHIPGTVAELEVPKPFAKSSEVTIHILPLKADPDCLRDLCDKLLNAEQTQHKFCPAAPYILMLVAQYEEMESGDERKWADTEVTFALPGRDENKKPFVLPLIGFANSEWNAISDREIYGRFTLQCSINVCDQRKADNLSLDKNDRKLWFYVQVPLMADRRDTEMAKAYSTIGVARSKADGGDPVPVNTDLRTWLEAVGFLPGQSGEFTFESAALKQIRDAAKPADLACYRELVTIKRQFSPTTDKCAWIANLDIKLQVIIRQFDNVDLATILCLEGGQRMDPWDPRNILPIPLRLESQKEDLLKAQKEGLLKAQKENLLQIVIKSIRDQLEFNVENPILIRGKLVAPGNN